MGTDTISREQLEAQAAALREALEAAQQHFINIGWDADPSQRKVRGRIGRIFEAAHQGKASIDATLVATDAGRELLERLRRAEAERDKMERQLAILTDANRKIVESIGI